MKTRHKISRAIKGEPKTPRQMINAILSELTENIENKREPLYKKPWFSKGII